MLTTSKYEIRTPNCGWPRDVSKYCSALSFR